MEIKGQFRRQWCAEHQTLHSLADCESSTQVPRMMDRLKQLLERRPGHLTPEECQWLFSEIESLRQQLAEADPYKPLWAVVEQLGLNEETGCPDSLILEHVSSLKEQLAEVQERIKLLIAADLPHVIQIDDLSQQLAASEAKNVLPITLEEINPLKKRQVARKQVYQEKGEGQKWLKTYAVVEDIDSLFSFIERLSHHQYQDHKLLEDKDRQLAAKDAIICGMRETLEKIKYEADGEHFAHESQEDEDQDFHMGVHLDSVYLLAEEALFLYPICSKEKKDG